MNNAIIVYVSETLQCLSKQPPALFIVRGEVSFDDVSESLDSLGVLIVPEGGEDTLFSQYSIWMKRVVLVD